MQRTEIDPAHLSPYQADLEPDLSNRQQRRHGFFWLESAIIVLLSLSILTQYLQRPSASEYAADRYDLRYPAAAMGRVPPCELVDCTQIDQALATLSVGDFIVKARDTMHLGVTTTVTAMLMPGAALDSATILLEALTSDIGVRISMHRVRYANRMVAMLSGSAFAVIPSAQEAHDEAISTHVPTQWNWEVTPIIRGAQSLRLALAAVLTFDGYETFRTLRVINHKVEVHATLWQRFSEVTEWLSDRWQLIVALAGIAVLIWRHWPETLSKKFKLR